jgi:transposase-like protein
MSRLSSIHQRFDTDPCQAYLQTRRWKDRPLPCPRCQSHHRGRWGLSQYRPGCQRYGCPGCRRTLTALPPTLLAQSKRSLVHWRLAPCLGCLSCSSRRIARALGGHIPPSYRWCWWRRNTALSYELQRQVEGTVEADALYQTAGHKGQAKQGGKKA